MPSTTCVTNCSRMLTSLPRANHSCMGQHHRPCADRKGNRRKGNHSAANPCQHSVSPIAALRLRQYDDRMSFGETIFLFLLALVVFGPKKLPEIARFVGKYLNEFKRASNEFRSQIEQEISHLDTQKLPVPPPALASASWAGDSHVTETLAPEGTASRTLNSTNPPTSAEAEPAIDATLAAPLIEDSNTHETSTSSALSDEASHPAAESAIDAAKTSAPQESHA
jgi:TatA/E family protein of Tat protein translocase